MTFARQLHVVTCVSNPLGTIARPTLARTFCDHMRRSGVHLTLVEAARMGRPFEMADEPGINYVPVRHSTVLWHKESLLNLGFARLPRDAEFIAWIDADVIFQSPRWAEDTIAALMDSPIVQPWETCADLDPYGMTMMRHSSFASLYVNGDPIHWPTRAEANAAHPGYAWAIRRDVLESVGGLFEQSIVGGGDRSMAMSVLGRVEETFYANLSHQFSEALWAWQDRARAATARQMGYVPGGIQHLWHGSKAKRAYGTRADILRRNGYNPVTDIRRNLDGVIELAGNKPDMARDILNYFAGRDEDAVA